MAEEVKTNTEVKEGKLLNNNYSKIIAFYLQYAGCIRDTLQFTLKNTTPNENLYKALKTTILKEHTVNSPLKSLIDNNGENGQKLLQLIEEFGNTIYGDDSTILKLADDGLRIDHAQNITIIELVERLYEEFSNIILSVLNEARKNNQLEAYTDHMVVSGERFYRGVFLLCDFLEIREQFNEFVKIMNENKGVKTAASNFVNRDLNKLFNLFYNSKNRSKIKDDLYINALDMLNNTMEMMMGRRNLPQGSNFGEQLTKTHEAIRNFLADAEKDFRATCVPAFQQLFNEAKEAREKAQVNSETK